MKMRLNNDFFKKKQAANTLQKSKINARNLEDFFLVFLFLKDTKTL